jgi:hypothetical protein
VARRPSAVTDGGCVWPPRRGGAAGARRSVGDAGSGTAPPDQRLGSACGEREGTRRAWMSSAPLVRHNLGIAAAGLGDAPRALWLRERAEDVFRAREMNYDAAILPRDRCTILLSVRLVPEARASAEQGLLGPGAPGEVRARRPKHARRRNRPRAGRRRSWRPP